MENWIRYSNDYSNDDLFVKGENVWRVGYPSSSTEKITNEELALEREILELEKKLERYRERLMIAKNRIEELEQQMKKLEEENEKLNNRCDTPWGKPHGF